MVQFSMLFAFSVALGAVFSFAAPIVMPFSTHVAAFQTMNLPHFRALAYRSDEGEIELQARGDDIDNELLARDVIFPDSDELFERSSESPFAPRDFEITFERRSKIGNFFHKVGGWVKDHIGTIVDVGSKIIKAVPK